MEIHLNMYQTLAVAVLVLLFGSFLRHRIGFLEKFCIPAPVIGGLLFAILTCLCYVTGIVEFSFDDTLREVCMVFFFTSVGFQANLKVLKSGGKIRSSPDTAGGAKKLTGGESRKRNMAGKRILPQKRRIQQETKHSSGNIVRFPMTLRNRHTGRSRRNSG